MKTCSSCQQSKPISEFYFMSKKNAFDSRCVNCRKEYRQTYYQTKIKGTDKPKQYRQKYRMDDDAIFQSRSTASKAIHEALRQKKIQEATRAYLTQMAAISRELVANRSIYRTLPDREQYLPDHIWMLEYNQFKYYYTGFWHDFNDDEWIIEK